MSMTLLSSYLDDGGWHTEAENVRNGVDLESYENELRLIVWLMAHLAQPAQSVDVEKVREVIAEIGYDRWGCLISLEGSQKLHALANKLTAALQEPGRG